jgi:hypothetical protein
VGSKHNEDLPVVREIRKQTDELIRLFDQLYLRLCGIRWEEDIDHALAVRVGPRLRRSSTDR